MKAAPLPRLFILPALSLFALAAVARSQPATGTIEGRVFNAKTASALANARVSVPAVRIEAVTDSSGSYRLAGVPGGEASVRVTYVGLEPETAAVRVVPGAVAQRDFELRIEGEKTVVLDAFTVVADRQMSAQAVALNERKNAANIRQVVAFDEYGDAGEENVGEMLRFLPGVGIIDGGATASGLSLRGMPSSGTVLQVDGADLATAGTSRAINLRNVPASGISRVEISKVPTPDMPASGIGGSVNIIGKNGFEAKRPVFNYKVFITTEQDMGLTLDAGPRGPTKKLSPSFIHPSFDFTYLHPVSQRFAFSFSGSRYWRLKPMERDDLLDTQADWNFNGGYQRLSTWLSLSDILQSWDAKVGADWKISDRDVLNVSYQHRYFGLNIVRLSFAATYGAGATGDATFTQGARTAVGSISQAAGTNQESGTDTDHVTVKISHRGDTWRLEALGSASQARAFLDDIDNGHFNAATSSLTGLILRGEGIGESDAHIPVRYSATNAVGAAVDLFNAGNYVLGNPTSNQNNSTTQKLNARVDLTRTFGVPVPLTLKTGISVDQTTRDAKSFAQSWTFTPNGQTTTAARLASNFDVFDSAFNATAPTVFGKPMNWISVTKFYDLYKARPDWFVRNEATYYQNYTANSRRLSETISAAYLRADVKLLDNRLLLVGGARLERTKDDGQGQLDDPTAQYQKDASGNLILGANRQPILRTTDALQLAKLRYTERGTRAIRTYSGIYPSLNGTYTLAENLLARAAYSQTISRPELGNIIPGTTISDPSAATPTIRANNTGLKPWEARGYDLSIESYQIKGGYGSIGVFQRDFEGFFNSVTTRATPELLDRYGLPDDPLYLNYDITTLTNGGSARIRGLEFAYNQQLFFLPHWARGLQIFANASRLRLVGGSQSDFSAFSPSNYSGGINLVRPRYFVKLTFTYQGETRQGAVAANAGNGIPAEVFNYQGERFRVGVSAQYSLTKRLALFGSMTDINGGFNVVNRQYAQGMAEYLKKRRRQELGSILTLGLRGEF